MWLLSFWVLSYSMRKAGATREPFANKVLQSREMKLHLVSTAALLPSIEAPDVEEVLRRVRDGQSHVDVLRVGNRGGCAARHARVIAVLFSRVEQGIRPNAAGVVLGDGSTSQ